MAELSILAFWACAAGVVYAYAAYPVLIWGLASLFGRRGAPPDGGPGELPRASLLIVAHDEEQVIEARVRNALATDYPAEKLEIVVASDGSTDGTASIVARYAGRGVRLLDYPSRRGKAAVLNEAFPELSGEIVLLSDANTSIDPAALGRIAARFRDPALGVLCGRLILSDPRGGTNADGLYWKYETFLKRCEARLGALLGANGAIYAMRRELFSPIPTDTLVDDLVIPLQARLQTGCVLDYDGGAFAVEEAAPGLGPEFRRRVRIGAGGFQSIARLWRLLDPRNGWVALTFFSHKLLRWLCPFFLLGALAAGWALRDREPYRLLLAGQVAFYLVAGLMALVPGRHAALRPLRLTTMFAAMNAALLLGFARWTLGGRSGTWARTPRVAAVCPHQPATT